MSSLLNRAGILKTTRYNRAGAVDWYHTSTTFVMPYEISNATNGSNHANDWDASLIAGPGIGVSAKSQGGTLSSQLQIKLDLALQYERDRMLKERNRPANDPFDSEDHSNPYIEGVDLSVTGVRRTILNSYFPFTYTFDKSIVNGVYVPGDNNIIYLVNYSNPPVLSVNYFGMKGYVVSFETKGEFARATLIFNDIATYNLFLSTQLGIK